MSAGHGLRVCEYWCVLIRVIDDCAGRLVGMGWSLELIQVKYRELQAGRAMRTILVSQHSGTLWPKDLI